jgi:hypothetical protein
LGQGELAPGSAGPFEASTWSPAASGRRHWFADIRDTRNRLAISRSLGPASISSAAASRTCSRRAPLLRRQPAVIGYLMTLAYPDAPAWRTYDSLAAEFRVGRERVRQLEISALQQLARAAVHDRYHPLRWRATTAGHDQKAPTRPRSLAHCYG